MLEYSDNYVMTSRCLWNYYQDEVNDAANGNDAANYKVNNNKTKIIDSTPTNSSRKNTEVVVTLKYLSNFWRSFDLPLINCKLELDLKWSKKCIIP